MKRGSGGGALGGRKRANADPGRSTPVLDLFRGFRASLDAISDQRERIIKTSRDITAESKKVIFTLHRITGSEPPEALFAEARAKLGEIRGRMRSVADDLRGADFLRFNRQITPGLQEFVEAVSFLHYLETGDLITHEAVVRDYLRWDDGTSLHMTEEDFLLGLSDLTGELMRHAINAVASGDSARAYEVLDFMRSITMEYRQVTPQHVYNIRKKVEVMEQSLEKVERACYQVSVRGSEYPKEMLAKLLQGDGPFGGGGGGGDDEDGGGGGGD